MPLESTRLAIVTQSLADTLERLREMAPSARVRELRAKALSFERIVRGWTTHPPTDQERAAMVRAVLELNVEVMGAGRE
jgi:hypothetical protein